MKNENHLYNYCIYIVILAMLCSFEMHCTMH